MDSRAEKYQDKSLKIGSRTARNTDLYKEINKTELDNFEVKSNATVIGNNRSNIDVEKIKDILDTHYKDVPQRRGIRIETDEQKSDQKPIFETKEYDINVIIDKAKEDKVESYEEERSKKLRNTQFDILNNLNINMSDEEFKHQFKIKNNEIIKEMQNVLKNNNFNEKCFDFIKLILNKYPPKNPFDKNFNIETEFEKNPKKVLLKIKTKYNPDNYSKESVENKAKYLMVQEIASMLNGIYSDLN